MHISQMWLYGRYDMGKKILNTLSTWSFFNSLIALFWNIVVKETSSIEPTIELIMFACLNAKNNSKMAKSSEIWFCF